MDFNYYAQIEDIAPRPVLFIIGTEAATIFMSKAGFEKAAKPKEWFEIPGATHHRLYDDEASVGKAVAKLEEFFGRAIASSDNGPQLRNGYRGDREAPSARRPVHE